jgi:hypothetical protein
MHRSAALFLSALLLLSGVARLEGAIGLELLVDRLNDAGGSAAPTSTLVLIVADTTGNGLATAVQGPNLSLQSFLQGVDGDDLVVHRTNLAAAASPGVLTASVTGLDFADDTSSRWGTGDPLYLLWFPTLTTASVNLSVGVPYGVLPLGNTPADSAYIDFTYVSPTNSGAFGSSPIPPSATNTAANQTSSPPPAPEIVVSGDGSGITSGSTTPALGNHSAFGSAAVAGGSVVRTFTITNTGSASLTLTLPISISGSHSADFSILTAPSTTVTAGGGTTTFEVSFDPSSPGTRSATLSFANNDADENPFSFAIEGTGANSAPTNITLTGTSLTENNEAGASIGSFATTDPDTDDTHTYSLVSGTGDTDNDAFTIADNILTITASANFESRPSYSIRVRSTDSAASSASFDKVFSISVTDINETPTNLQLSGDSLDENNAVNATVGIFSASDPDAGDSVTYQLVSGVGDDDNASFSIAGAALKIGVVTDFETLETYSVRVRATDSGNPGLFVEATFTITVLDVNETPGDIVLSGSSLAENNSAGATVGTLSLTDPLATLPVSFSLVSGDGSTDNASFSLTGATLSFIGVANFEQKDSYSLRIRATDSRTVNPRIVEETFTVTITDVNEAPSNLQLSATSLSESSSADSMIGELSVDDPDEGDLPTFTLVAGSGSTDNAAFEIRGSGLYLIDEPDFETKSSYELRIRATDSGAPAQSVEQAFTVTIFDANEAPSFVGGPDQSLARGTTSLQTVANWATEITDGDPSANQALSFDVEILSGASLFTVVPTVSSTGTLVYQVTGSPGQAELSVVLTDDATINGTPAIASAAQTFTISVTASDIALVGNGVDIVNGDSTPDSGDDTDFGLLALGSSGGVKTFRIENNGDADLTLGSVALQGAQAADFSITQTPDSSIEPGAFSTLEITFLPTALGLRSATVSIPSNDPDSSPFSFAIAGTGGAPEIVVENGGTSLSDGATLPFPSVPLSTETVKTLTIRNSGAIALTDLAITIEGPQAAEFSVADLSVDSLEPDESVEIAISITPTSTGARSALLKIASDDADENPFDLNLSAVIDGREGKVVTIPGTDAPIPELGDASWESDAAGAYEGLLYTEDDLVGAISNLRVTAPPTGSLNGGTVTASVRLNKTSSTLRGSFDADGKLVSAAGASLGFDLQLQSTAESTFAIAGTVTLNGLTAQAYLAQTPYSTRFPIPDDRFPTGPYTLLFPSSPGSGDTAPGGDGWATATLSSSGAFSLTGRLGDGTTLTETAYLTAQGELFVFAELYSSTPGKGLIGGRLTFRSQTGSDLDGSLRWVKANDPRTSRRRERVYPNGFDVDPWVIGCRFTPPEPNARALELEDQYYNAELSLFGPTAPSATAGSLHNIVTWYATNRIVHFGPRPITATVNTRTGSFSGTFSDPAIRLSIGLGGVVYQKQNIAAGLFSNANKTGSVRILPGTDFAYPGREDAGTLTRLSSPDEAAAPPDVTEETTFPTAAAGTYNGIVSLGAVTTGAIESVVVSSSGAFSGSLWLQGVRLALRGNIGQETTLSDGTTVTLTLGSMTGVPNGYVLQGSVRQGPIGSDNPEASVNAQRRPTYTRTSPSPWRGAYTVALLAPESVDASVEPGGDGYGTLSVPFGGTVSGLITLADGTKVTLAGHIGLPYTDESTQTALWSFHRGLYGRTPKGFVAGTVAFRNVAGVSNLDGQWLWEKQDDASATSYPDGFATSRSLIGSLFVPPARNTRAMTGLDPTTDNVWLRFSQTDLSSLPDLELNSKDLTGTWQADNRIIHYGPQSVSLSLDTRTGLLTGSYRDTANGINFSFGGVLIQSQNLLTGSFLTQGQSGLFVIEKR